MHHDELRLRVVPDGLAHEGLDFLKHGFEFGVFHQTRGHGLVRRDDVRDVEELLRLRGLRCRPARSVRALAPVRLRAVRGRRRLRRALGLSVADEDSGREPVLQSIRDVGRGHGKAAREVPDLQVFAGMAQHIEQHFQLLPGHIGQMFIDDRFGHEEHPPQQFRGHSNTHLFSLLIMIINSNSL